jgi:DNA-binding IclR family transcriptional regulator
MVNPEQDRPARRIRSVEIALNVIDVIQEEGRVGVTELADELGHSKSTIHSHLRTLEEKEFLVREDDRYRMSLQILNMANHVREQVGNYEVIRDEIDMLAVETGEIAQFGLEEHGQVAYLYKTTGERGVETASEVGAQQPMHSTALGKTILSCLSEERTEELIQSMEFERKIPNTITSESQLREELEAIRERGYGIDDEENIEGLRCVAAPVSDNGDVLGAVSITGPSSRFTIDRIHDDLSDRVQRAANVIELNTKFAQ